MLLSLDNSLKYGLVQILSSDIVQHKHVEIQINTTSKEIVVNQSVLIFMQQYRTIVHIFCQMCMLIKVDLNWNITVLSFLSGIKVKMLDNEANFHSFLLIFQQPNVLQSLCFQIKM